MGTPLSPNYNVTRQNKGWILAGIPQQVRVWTDHLFGPIEGGFILGLKASLELAGIIIMGGRARLDHMCLHKLVMKMRGLVNYLKIFGYEARINMER